jgi:DNA-binding MarR family transcriptional regulator
VAVDGGDKLANEATDEAGEPIMFGRGFMLWQVANGWQRAARAVLAPTGLTYVQTLLLAGLAERLETDGRITQAGLAQALGADAMMTSQVLRTLESAGLVRRERDPTDTRARNVALTPEGARKLSDVRPLLAEIDESFFDPLGKKEKRFVKSLKKLWRTRRADDPPASGKARAGKDTGEDA